MSLAVMPSQFLRIKDVCTLTAISQSHVYALQAKGQFPQSRKIAAKVSVWRAEDVQEWWSSNGNRQHEPQSNGNRQHEPQKESPRRPVISLGHSSLFAVIAAAVSVSDGRTHRRATASCRAVVPRTQHGHTPLLLPCGIGELKRSLSSRVGTGARAATWNRYPGIRDQSASPRIPCAPVP